MSLDEIRRRRSGLRLGGLTKEIENSAKAGSSEFLEVSLSRLDEVPEKISQNCGNMSF